MLRTALICVCLLGLTGCEAFSQLAWWYVEHGHSSEPGNPSVTPSAEQLPSKHMLLDDGRLLEATWAGLQVVDVRDRPGIHALPSL